MTLWKTTIVIWSDTDPSGAEIDDLARDAMTGDSFCSVQRTSLVGDPESDPDWVPTDFFDTDAMQKVIDDDYLRSTDQRKLARD